MRCFASAIVAAAALAFGGHAQAQVVFTEWAYQGGGSEFIEFTNRGASAVSLAGWSFDDDGRTPGSFDLSSLGSLAAGESAVITDLPTAGAFRTEWGLPSWVKVIAGNVNNLSRADEINLYNGLALVDRLTYGDQTFPGTIRTNVASGIPSSPAALGANDVALWQLAAVGDQFGSYASASGGIGNPGSVPEPASLTMGALAALLALKLRKRG